MRIHIIVFSFNRAMQCDTVLRSIVLHLGGADVTVSVIWHATELHNQGYMVLNDIYKEHGIRFYERSQRERGSFFDTIFPRLYNVRNLYHWIKYKQVRSMDNFPVLLEKLIESTPADLVSFNTDDNIYYADEVLTEQVFARILERPKEVSYRTYVGSNQQDCPSMEIEGDLLAWDYYDPQMYRHWAYPFSVDGTFYERAFLLAFLRSLLYHNPVTLESFGVSHARAKHLFAKGLSPKKSTMVALPLNKVDMFVASNRRGNIDVDYLNSLFVAGYRLEYELPSEISVSGFIPNRVWATKNGDRIELLVQSEL